MDYKCSDVWNITDILIRSLATIIEFTGFAAMMATHQSRETQKTKLKTNIKTNNINNEQTDKMYSD